MHQGNRVVLVDRTKITPTKEQKSRIKIYSIDIENAKKVDAVFQKEKPDFVFHLAGPIHLRRDITDPLFLKDVNFLSRTSIILEACKKHGVKKIIFVSSGGAIYQDAVVVPTPEDYQVHPTLLYGLANMAIEKFIQLYGKKYKIHFTIARLSNAYGPGQWQTGIIPATILKMLKNESPVIYGNGRQTRDFLYIDDVVSALIILAQKGSNAIYNIGSGRETSLHEVFLHIKKMLKSPVVPTHQEITVKETQRSAMDVKKIKKELGWSPKISIKEGLLKTIQWYGK